MAGVECAAIGTGPSTAVNIVEDGWNRWSGYSQVITTSAINYIEALSDLSFDEINSNVSMTVDGQNPLAFSAPTAPEIEEFVINYGTQPVAKTLEDGYDFNFPPAPNLTATEPTLNFPVAPGDSGATAPGTPPSLSDPTIPSSPSYTLPSVPTLAEIDLPTIPTIDLPTFTATAPTEDIVVPANTFVWNEDAFSDDLLDDLVAKVTEWLDGGTGLPDCVWDAIWERDRRRERQSGKSARQQVKEEWSARNFSLPSGPQDAKLKEIDLAILAADNQVSREVAIKQAEMEQTNMHFAITQGVALVSFIGQMHHQQMQRAFEAAKFAFQVTIDIFNAEISLYKAKLDGYRIEAEVFKALIEAELAKLETYKAELEGQKLVNEINEQDINLYNSQLQGVLAVIEVYKAEISAVNAQVSVDKTKIDAYAALVNAYATEVNAYVAEVEAYSKKLSAEKTKADIYGVQVDAYAAEVSAYKGEIDSKASQNKSINDKNMLLIEEYKSGLQAWTARFEAELTRVKAVLERYATDAKVYEAEGSIAESSSKIEIERYRTAVLEGQAEAEIAIKNIELNIEQALRSFGIEADNARIAAQAYGQLAAASMSAVELVAQISSSGIVNSGCTTSYSNRKELEPECGCEV